MTEPALELDQVTLRYGDHTVLDRFNLRVLEGERVALIGPSGSGKTTVLRVAMALVRPDEGKVAVFGRPYWRDGKTDHKLLREVRRPVGMVFQAYNLFPHFTVLENMLEAPVGARGMDKREATQRAEELLARVGLSDKRDAFPRSLSGGQQQRAAIARALMLRPRLLLLDEVTSALDPELVTEVLNVIKSVAEDSSVAMVIVTHEMSFAHDVSHRVCMMDAGQIVEEGPPDQIFRNPQHPRTRDFFSHLSADIMATFAAETGTR